MRIGLSFVTVLFVWIWSRVREWLNLLIINSMSLSGYFNFRKTALRFLHSLERNILNTVTILSKRVTLRCPKKCRILGANM